MELEDTAQVYDVDSDNEVQFSAQY